MTLLTGNLGKDGAGLNPLRGQNNVQGASDMGCNPVNLLDTSVSITKKPVKESVLIWGQKLSAKPGLTATEMTDAMLDGTITGMWIMGENPVLSDPNMCHALDAFE